MQLARQYEGKVAIVGIAGRDDIDPMRAFARKYSLPFPNGADLDLSIWKRLRVRGQPAWVFIAPDGTARLFYRPDDATVRTQLDHLRAANVATAITTTAPSTKP